MARHMFGGALPDWTFTRTSAAVDIAAEPVENLAQLVTGATVTFWNLQVGGSRHLDLLDTAGEAISGVVSSDGGDGLEPGSIPVFQGPDGITHMWADAGGARAVITAWDVGDAATAAAASAATTAANLASHVGGANPHGTRMVDLADTNLAGITDGQIPAFNVASGTFLPVSVEGVSGVVFLAGEQTVTGHKVFLPSAAGNRAVTLQAAAAQTADLLQALTAAGLLALRLGPQGELFVEAPDGVVGTRVKARAGQTAHLSAWLSSADDVMAWIDTTGRVRGPNQGYVFPYSLPGELAITTGRHRIYNDTGVNLTIRAVRASVGVAPTGGDILVDINRSGTSIFTTQANRPEIADGTNTSGRVTSFDVMTLVDGEYLTVDVDAIGATTPGEDLTVQVLCY